DVVAVIEKMSKSKGNVVAPDPILETFGADTMRLYILFIGPPEADAEWTDDGVLGPNRFLNRLWEVVATNAERLKGAPSVPADPSKLSDAMRAARRKTHLTVKQVTETMEGDLHFNTAISHVMELINELKGVESWEAGGPDGLAVLREGLEAAVRLLAPFIPHLSEELWTLLGHEPSVFRAPWPTYDEKALEVEQVEIVVQVNGKMRSKVTVESGIAEDAVKAAVLADEKVKKSLEGATVKNLVVVPGRLVNIVVDRPEAATEAAPAT
ncbi:MAG: class I tRNA ligase family protein, partial [Planctomycetota bacterium]